MNRLECLQMYPEKYRKIFYFAAPTIFIFYTLAILVCFFDFSFQEVRNYWYMPALLGGLFNWYISRNVIFTDKN